MVSSVQNFAIRYPGTETDLRCIVWIVTICNPVWDTKKEDVNPADMDQSRLNHISYRYEPVIPISSLVKHTHE